MIFETPEIAAARARGHSVRSPHHMLGTHTEEGRVYVYTALGTFPTIAAAVEACEEPRAIVFQACDVYSAGARAPFGMTAYVAVASCLGTQARRDFARWCAGERARKGGL